MGSKSSSSTADVLGMGTVAALVRSQGVWARGVSDDEGERG